MNEKEKSLQLWISLELHSQLKYMSIETGKTIAEIVRENLEKVVKDYKHKKRSTHKED
jgi:predicted DNA-binding protein